MMAPRSSITAKAVKKTLRDRGTLLPNNDKIPMANAMSVAIGIPYPEWVVVPELKTKYNTAGTIIPPNAAEKGSRASLNFESSPT